MSEQTRRESPGGLTRTSAGIEALPAPRALWVILTLLFGGVILAWEVLCRQNGEVIKVEE